MKKRVAWLTLFLLFAIVPSLYYGFFAFILREHFYHGLPASHWERAIRRWNVGDSDMPAVLGRDVAEIPVLLDLIWSANEGVATRAVAALAQTLPETEQDETSITDAYAVKIGTSVGGQIALIVSANRPHVGASRDIVLLSHTGRFLDTVSCSIGHKERLSGIFDVEVAREAKTDGAHFVVRYTLPDGKAKIHDWCHKIKYANTIYDNYCRKSFPQDIGSTEWEERGLCRIAVCDGKFAILWPPLVEKETALLPTSLLGITLYFALTELGNREIERLIGQLGSSTFKQREQGSHKHKHIAATSLRKNSLLME